MARINKKIRITAGSIGILLGLSGIFNHGLFEILQGYKPTNGFFIEAIGETHRYWTYGTEGAFTLIHNYLLTGIAEVVAGLAIVYWSMFGIQKKFGATVFFILMLMLTLTGGGIGYIVLFIPVWAFATQINKPLTWWEDNLPSALRRNLSVLWLYFLTATLITWLIVMELGIFGYFPGKTDPDALLKIVFIFLFSAVALACVTFLCAISGDIKKPQPAGKTDI